MLTDIKIGQYFPANSILHKLDARFKIVSLLFLIVGIFIFDNQLSYIIWCAIVGGLIKISKIPVKMFFNSIKTDNVDYFIYIHIAFVQRQRRTARADLET